MSKQLQMYLLVLIVMTIIFTYGSFIYPHSATSPDGASLQKPSTVHLLGTDDLGIDIFAQISRGFFLSLLIGAATAVLSLLLGGSLGVAAGYLGGRVDDLLSFILNLFLSLPQLPVMIVLGAFFGQSTWHVIVIITLFSWAAIAKIVRAKTMQLRSNAYITLARSYGGGFWYIFSRHLSAEILPLLLINSLAVVGKAIIQEASLAFLGLSDPLAKSWGLMINKAMNFGGIYYTDYWQWWLLAPLFSLVATIYCLRMLAWEMEKEIIGKERV
ncbi:MAG TPA: ABC transporter permease [Oscillospiraceae bacterium]|nr:ABC transporter permease [Oscillospiraceae bacterium]